MHVCLCQSISGITHSTKGAITLVNHAINNRNFSNFCAKQVAFTLIIRECVSTGTAGARICRSLRHHLLHLQILSLLVPLKPADFEAQSSLLKNRLHPQIQIPTACPDNQNKLRSFHFLEKLDQFRVYVEAIIYI